MQAVVSITKALADENRLRILLALRGGELCVCQITELLGLAASTVSRHLAILRQAGLVTDRKEGRWIYYQRHCCCADADCCSSVLDWLDAYLAREPRIREDARELKAILKIDPEELCRRACKS